MRTTIRRLGVVVALVLVAGLLRVTEANPAIAQTQTIGAWRVTSEPVLDGSSPEWQSIAPVFLPTTAQQVTPPMGGGTVQRVAVRAVHWDDRLYIMLEWSDPTPDYLSDRPEAFTDAAAVQFPAEAGSTVPYICMGQADQAVNIWQWRSDQQEPAPSLPPDGYVDMYQFTDDLYHTAREAGNPLSQRGAPVQNLVAGGFGTLTAGNDSGVDGNGVYRDGRWMVVFTRPFQPQGDLEPAFDGAGAIDVAFAMWDGSQGERDGIKSISAFTRMAVSSEDPPRRAVNATGDWPAYKPPSPFAGVAIGFTILMLIVVAGLGAHMRMRRRSPDEPDG